MNVNSVNREDLEYLIDSDNQLPGEYFEDETVPAYHDDTRFQKIQFKWLRSRHEEQPHPSQLVQNDTNNKSSSLKNDILEERTKNLDVGVNSLLLSYYFKIDDIYCLKSVEPHMSDENMLRFIHFLISKSINSCSNRRRGCLVSDYKMNNSSYAYDRLSKKHYRFELTVEH